MFVSVEHRTGVLFIAITREILEMRPLGKSRLPIGNGKNTFSAITKFSLLVYALFRC